MPGKPMQSNNSLALGSDNFTLRNQNEQLRKELMIIETELQRIRIKQVKDEQQNSPSGRSKATSDYGR